MFKKFTAFLTAVLLVLCFAGCTKGQTKEQVTEQTTAQTQQPEQQKDNENIVVPYMVGYKFYGESDYWAEWAYGLMTADGESVTEPIYNYYCTFVLDGKTYYCLQVVDDMWAGTCNNSLLISADGKWQLEIKDRIVAISENRIICQQSEDPFTVYDYNGNKIFSGNEYQTVDTDSNGFYNGLLVVFDFLSDNGYTTVVDENGKIVLDKLDYCGSFITGKAVASYNRDDGYGIITPEGEWLLEPKYTDIKTVDGKYFIAIDYDREYIYDSDLKLLRERECGTSDADICYFYEINGRLLRQYAHITSPDDYYRDAFTDEIISCGEAKANVCTSESKTPCFYDVDRDGGTLCAFDVDGNLLNKLENLTSISFEDGAYVVTEDSGKTVCYNEATHKEMISLELASEYGVYAETVGDCGLVNIRTFKLDGMEIEEETYSIYNYKKGEYVFEGCEYSSIKELDGKVYVTVAYTDCIEIYDSDLNLIAKSENILQK